MKTYMKIHRKILPAVALGVVVLMVPVVGFSGEEIDKTLEMSADGLVQVENLAGSIEFATWDRSEVQIRGEAGDDVEEVEITATSKGIQVRVHNRKDARHIDGTDLYLRVPEAASIEADSVSADISISGNRGESIMLNTVSGDLEIDATPQRLELQSVSGDVEFEGSVMRSSTETVSGEITLVGVAGEVGVSTVSGDVSLEAGEVSRGRFESVSGEMTLALSLGEGGRLTCDSMSGDVKLRLPASQQAEFTAQSYSGNINTEFGNSARVSNGPGVMLQHREGDSGTQIRLETFSGDISIRTQ
jgi:DUF4097 and DUF4098 domain-containing protein YvlB